MLDGVTGHEVLAIRVPPIAWETFLRETLIRFHRLALYRTREANQDPGDSPSNQTGLANRMHEAHLNHDDLINSRNSVISLGKLTDELEQMRQNMNR